MRAWSAVKKRDGFYQKADANVRAVVDSWVRQHPHVVASPIAGDSVLLPDPADPSRKIRKNKLILQCSKQELFCDLCSADKGPDQEVVAPGGRQLIGDTTFRALLPPELCVMNNRHKLMCCCSECVQMDFLHKALCAFRPRLLRSSTRSSTVNF